MTTIEPSKTPVTRPQLLALSAASADELRQRIQMMAEWLARSPELALEDVCAAAAAEPARAVRLGIVVRSCAEAAERLASLASSPDALPARADGHPRVALVFSGYGGQWLGMARDLLLHEPVFARVIDACSEVFSRLADWWSLRDEILATPETSHMHRPAVVQPMIFAVQVGVAAMWRSWGIEPAAVIGHSIGEVAAAHVAGALSLENAARIIGTMGRLYERGPGTLALVALSAERLEQALAPYHGRIYVAAINSPSFRVLSGEVDAIRELSRTLRTQNVFCRELPDTTMAAHSPIMDSILDELSAALQGLAPQSVRTPIYSSLRGDTVDGSALGPAYWCDSVRQPVRFSDAIEAAIRDGYRLFVEVGPQPLLAGSIKEILRGADVDGRAVASLRRGEDDRAAMLGALATLYAEGSAVSWAAVAPATGRRVALPAPVASQDVHEVQVAVGAELDIAQRVLAAPEAERRALLVGHVCSLVAEMLELPPGEAVAADQGFFTLGLDSRMSLQIQSRLEQGLGLSLPATLAFEYPTPAALADYLADALARRAGVQSAPASHSQPVRAASRRVEDEARDGARNEAIAIVGMACRMPGEAHTPAAFWEFLRAGREAICEVPADRWDVDELFDPEPGVPGKMYVRRGGFIQSIDQFDAQFFSIPPREALYMDPRQRIALEMAWEALEHAGQAPNKLVGSRTGVFMGASSNDYLNILRSAGLASIHPHHITGNLLDFISGRISYVLGLRGPSMAIDTACASSLVAVHLACQALRAGECELALAGGVNAILTEHWSIAFSQGRMLAPDGRCKAFDASADGYVRSEGGGIVVLKRLSDALASGDHVIAVIRGSAVNQDGPSSGITVPSATAQAALIRDALASAGVAAEAVTYVEAHGTGTRIGDPIEVRGLTAALCESRPALRPLLIGSVKTNIGHLEPAAGIAGLLKTVLALQQDEIPAQLHLHQLNPTIPWSELPIRVVTEPTPWPADAPRIAGVSSFGISGTNAHVVVERAPQRQPRASRPARPLHILCLSARSASALRELAARYLRHLEHHPELDWADVCYTANAGRAHFDHRLTVVAASADEGRKKLSAFLADQPASGVLTGRRDPRQPPRIAFLFTGQAQYGDMARELFATQPTFAAALQRCDAVLRGTLSQSLLSVLYPEPGAASPLDDTLYAHPAMCAVELALCELWRAWGIEPAFVMGHSLGEYAAACAAGILDVEDALFLVAERARLIDQLPRDGAMVALAISEAAAAEAVRGHAVSVAAVNAPESVVISGREHAVQAVVDELQHRGVKAHRLNIACASHSAWMEPILAPLEQVAARVSYRSPRIPIMSNVTGSRMDGAAAMGPDYWSRHARQTVRFRDGLQAIHDQGCRLFLEIGPKPTLAGLVELCVPAGTAVAVPSLSDKRGNWAQMLDSLAALYTRGVDVDWARFDADYARCRVPLPTYPFEHRRYWPSIQRPAQAEAGQPAVVLAAAADSAGIGQPAARPEASESRVEDASSLLQELRQATAADAAVLLGDRMCHLVAATLGFESEDQVDVQRPFQELGLDSLVAVQLRNKVGAWLERALPATVFFDHPTIAALSVYLADLVRNDDARADAVPEPVLAAPVPPGPGIEPLLDWLESLSDAEVDRMLAIRR